MENDFKYILYCFLNDKGAVFLNRWGEHISQLKTYTEIIEYAKNNFHLIDVKLDRSNLKKCFMCGNKLLETKLTTTVRVIDDFETGFIDVCNDCF